MLNKTFRYYIFSFYAAFSPYAQFASDELMKTKNWDLKDSFVFEQVF